MISSKFYYRSPSDVQEAISLYQEFQGKAVYLSGGTDLIPRLKLGLQRPRAVIDLKRIRTLTETDDQGEWVRIGALVRIFNLSQNELVASFFPALKASLQATSCETLQMRGTIGGNLLQDTRCLFYNQSEFWRKSKGFCLKMGGESCNAVPGARACFANYCSDNAMALCTLSALIELAGPDGTRRLPLEDLYGGTAQNPFTLHEGEILTAILVPKRRSAGGYEKLRLRGSIDYPLLGLAFSVVDGTGKLAVGAVGARPYVAGVTQPFQESIEEAIETVLRQLRLAANAVLDPAYRKRMIPVLARRLVKKVLGEVR
ncbi:MAG: FAD binding domain-containing protein [Thermodesulfobacteriota bacterium]